MNILFAENIPGLIKLMEENPGSHLMAGGTDLLVKFANRQIRPGSIICLEKVEELRRIREEASELWIGSAATQQNILDSTVVCRRLGLLCQALDVLGSPPIRHAATLGGNLCTASPAGDGILALQVLEARVELVSASGKRQVPVEAFIRGPGRTSLGKDEIISAIIVPLKWDGMCSGFYKIGHRKSLAIAIASLAAAWRTDGSGTIENIKLGWGSVGPTVLRFPDIEKWLEGRKLSHEVLREAKSMIHDRFSPIDDIRATAVYRREAAGNLLFNLLEQGISVNG